LDDFFWFHVSLHGPSLAKLLTEVMWKVGGPILNVITVIVREVAVRLRSWCCGLKVLTAFRCSDAILGHRGYSFLDLDNKSGAKLST
jgi:phenylpyruvate tautomerase PptA (4-oxalocrotonate tautomerase family)